MYCLLVLNEITLCSCLVVTFPSWKLLSFMHRLLVRSEIFFQVAGVHIPCRETSVLYALSPGAFLDDI
jgi:hypothetical protein